MCQARRELILKSVPDRKPGCFFFIARKGGKASELLSYIVMTKYLRISILVKPQLLSAKPQHFSTLLSLNPQFVLLFLVISLSSYFCGTKLLERCERWRCLRGVWQVVRAACKPPDVSETSHWRRSRRAGGLQQQAERADYHGGLDAIRSPGRRQQIWHTPGLQDCPWEKVKGILYMHAETS